MHDLHSIKSWDFHGAEKTQEGLKRKDKGNEALQRGDVVRAIQFYRRALEFVGEDYGMEETDKPGNVRARITVLNNLAQVMLNIGNYQEAMVNAKKVLEIESTNDKALFRLAKAQDALQNWDDAKHNIDHLLYIQPNNANAKALRAQIVAKQKAYDQKQKNIYKKMFS